MSRKKPFSVEQLKLIQKILVLGAFLGGFLIWTFLPWNIPIYHKGTVYYEGPKLPLLVLLVLPFLSFLQDKSGLETMRLKEDDSPELREAYQREQRKGLLGRIRIVIVEAVVVFVIMLGILIVS